MRCLYHTYTFIMIFTLTAAGAANSSLVISAVIDLFTNNYSIGKPTVNSVPQHVLKNYTKVLIKVINKERKNKFK
jgi:hypothetical protein